MAIRYFVVGPNTNTTASWSASSGGAGGQSIPIAGDYAIFDAASPAATVNATLTARDFDFSTYANTITQTSGLVWAGDGTATNQYLYLGSSMTWAGATTLTITGTTPTGNRMIVNANQDYIFSAQTSGTAQTINRLFFYDANTGWAACNGGVMLYTTNGGTNWSIANTGGETCNFNSVFFISSTVGWATSAPTSNPSLMACIWSSTNGGANWTPYAPLNGAPATTCYGIHFYDSSNGLACNASGVYVTANGGTSWASGTMGYFTGACLDVSMVGTATAFGCDSSGNIGKTTNSGTSWTIQTASGNTLNTIQMVNSTTGWTAGNPGIWKTSNGTSWASSGASLAGIGNTMYACRMIDTSNGWGCGAGGQMTKTIDGTAWVQKNLGALTNLITIFAYDTTNIWAAGASGKIYKWATSARFYNNTLTLNATGTAPTLNLQDNFTVSAITASSGSTMTLNEFSGTGTLYDRGNLTISGSNTTNSISGATGTIVLSGTGTWNHTTTARILCNVTINTAGTITLGTNIYYSTGTLTYTTGTIAPATNTLNLVNASCTLNTGAMGWYNVTGTDGLTYTLNSALSVTNNLTPKGSTWAGSFGWTAKNLLLDTAGMTLTLSSTATYAVTTAMTDSASTTGSRITIASSSGSVQTKLNLAQASTQDLAFVNGTRVDSSGGKMVMPFKGTFTTTVNWMSLQSMRFETSYVGI